ncbi:MAG: hypothetical protein IJ225_08425 [Solobacterium sp.]|nr:hypothetical protein [Solobacterium sp.]
MKKRVFSILSLLIGLIEAIIPCMLGAVTLGAFLYFLISHTDSGILSDFITMEKEVWQYVLEYIGNILLSIAIFGAGLGIFASMRKEPGFESFAGLLVCVVMAGYFLIH